MQVQHALFRRGCVAFALLNFLLYLACATAEAAGNPGQVTAWNQNGTLQTNLPAGLTNFIAIAAAGFDNLALRSDGTVIAWGLNASGVTNVPAGLTGVKAIALGGIDNDAHALALKQDGTVVCWGTNNLGQLNQPTNLNHVVSIAAGRDCSFAIKDDHTLVGWGVFGGNSYVVVGAYDGKFTNAVAGVAAGDNFGVSVNISGVVSVWGPNPPLGQPPGPSNVVAVAAGEFHIVALKNDGTVVSWGNNAYNQTNTPAGLSNVIAISAGSRNSLALKNDGTVVVWGFTESLPAGLSNVVAVSGGGNANGSKNLALSIGFNIPEFKLSGGSGVLRFHTFAGRHYSVESAPGLSAGGWLPLPGGDVQGTGQDMTVTDTNASITAGFYRIKVIP